MKGHLKYNMTVGETQKNTRLITLIVLMLLLVTSFAVCLGIGRVRVPVIQVVRILLSNFFTLKQTWTDSMYSVVMVIRLPRLVANIIVGSALALSGATYQGLFKNPLVSPDLLGVSNGAGVGASMAILLGMSGLGIQISAFLCSFLAVGLTVWIASRFVSRDNLVLVLSGIIVSGFMSSLLSFFRYSADPNSSLPRIVFWLMGSMAPIRFNDIAIVIIPIAVCSTILIGVSWKINVISLGADEAQTLGVDIRKFRGICIICSTIITSSVVSISGTIGWFGLVIPHIGRLLVGSVHEYLLPVSMVAGGVFMIILDTTARTITAGELPISVMTGLIGAPVFAYILLRRKNNF